MYNTEFSPKKKKLILQVCWKVAAQMFLEMKEGE
jgi:hypothetical protein